MLNRVIYKRYLLLLVIGFLLLVMTGCSKQAVNSSNSANENSIGIKNQDQNSNINNSSIALNSITSGSKMDFIAPISDAPSRITKKPFGIYITPTTSPVQPERFTGYHTGVDFEILPSEENTDVPVAAACTGKVRIRQRVSGYGGVLIQDCVLSGESVTVLYGHLNLDSITAKVGQNLLQRDFIGNLGKGYSTQTDGERKHLHLSVHKGTAIDYKGYVSTESQLSDWLDPQKLF